MVVGFNHNFLYKGEVYHIQTEDSGRNSPNIVTLLYCGGTILASKKTSYADIAKVSNLEQVVEELMKEQHKEMLRSLKAGEFDPQIARFEAARSSRAATSTATPAVTPAVTPAAPTPVAPAEIAPAAKPSQPVPAAPVAASQPTAAPIPTPTPIPPNKKSSVVEASLDEVILSYLMGEGD